MQSDRHDFSMVHGFNPITMVHRPLTGVQAQTRTELQLHLQMHNTEKHNTKICAFIFLYSLCSRGTRWRSSSVSNRNEYQGCLLGVKAAGA